ncbi:MAG: phage terminase large subunit, partial [Synergistaceae bacterium]|nr:phage terminase large subunit [Synergistaceae bacterium]
AVVLRKVASTLRDSVFAQYMWAIDMLGMARYWKSRTNPMRLKIQSQAKTQRGA